MFVLCFCDVLCVFFFYSRARRAWGNYRVVSRLFICVVGGFVYVCSVFLNDVCNFVMCVLWLCDGCVFFIVLFGVVVVVIFLCCVMI